MKRPKTVAADAQCVDEAAMHRADYVHPRSGSKVWQFYLHAPPDLIPHFGSQWVCRKSLGATDLREANARAKQWAAEWQHEFDRIRGNPARRTGAPIPAPTLVTYPEWQSLKNKPSWREAPLHPELKRLGFLDYSQAMREADHERLFPLVQVSDTNNAGGGRPSGSPR